MRKKMSFADDRFQNIGFGAKVLPAEKTMIRYQVYPMSRVQFFERKRIEITSYTCL